MVSSKDFKTCLISSYRCFRFATKKLEFPDGSRTVASGDRQYHADWEKLPNGVREHILTHVSCNTSPTTRVEYRSGEKPLVTGKTTEGALIMFADHLGGGDCVERRNALASRQEYQFGFSSSRKMMSSLLRNESGGGFMLYITGGSDVVLNSASHYMKEDGSLEPLTDAKRDTIQREAIRPMANKALRTLALAVKRVDSLPDNWEEYKQHVDIDKPIALESGFTLYTIVGIKDPLRPEVPESGESCRFLCGI